MFYMYTAIVHVGKFSGYKIIYYVAFFGHAMHAYIKLMIRYVYTLCAFH